MQELKTIDTFAKQDRLIKWVDYSQEKIELFPEGGYDRSNSSVGQKVVFNIPVKGLLDKLVVKIVVTSRDNYTGSERVGIWSGLSFLDNAILYCGKEQIYEIHSTDLLGLFQLSSISDLSIYQDASQLNFSGTQPISNNDVMTFYVPLLFGCFESVDQLIDTEFVQPLRLVLDLQPTNTILLNNSGSFYTDITVIEKFNIMTDYLAFYKKRYSSLPYKIKTYDMYHENTFLTPVLTAGSEYTTPKMQLFCDKYIQTTYIFVAPNYNYLWMNGEEISYLELYDQDKVVHKSNSVVENMIMDHTEYRREPYIKDNSSTYSSLVYIINHGIYSINEISNGLNMKDKFMFLKLKFTPKQSKQYNIFVVHEYLKDISFNDKGIATNIY